MIDAPSNNPINPPISDTNDKNFKFSVWTIFT